MCCKLDWNLIFDGISALATLATFIFSIIIFRNISFKTDLRRKQLDTVFELVNQLQNLKLYFSYNLRRPNATSNSSFSGDSYYHFFQMTKESFNNIDAFKNTTASILTSQKFLYENKIFEFVDNPFLPQSIAKKLINLYPRGGNTQSYLQYEGEVNISDDRNYSTHTYRKEISQYYSTLSKLFETTEALHKSIVNWLERNGVSDLNFRDKLINNQNFP